MTGLQQLPVNDETSRQKDQALIPAPVKTENLNKYYRKNRQWQGIPSIAATGRGVLYFACYSGGDGEGAENYVIVERSEDAVHWSEPIAVVDPEGDVRAFDMCLWTSPLGYLFLFWSQSYGGFDGRAGVFCSICKNPEDEKPVWGPSYRITDGVMLNKPIVGEDGEYLLALSLWNNVPYGFTQEGLDPRIKLFASDTGENFWQKHRAGDKLFFHLRGGFSMERRYYDEPMVVRKKDGRLWMLVRLPEGIGEAFSDDGGKNWKNIGISDIWGPNSRFYIGRLRSGNLLLLNHLRKEDEPAVRTEMFPKRSRLAAWISKDDGASFSKPFVLDEREDISYPDAAEDDKGNIYIIYDHSRFEEKEIILCRLTEEEILEGKIFHESSFLRCVIDKAGDIGSEGANSQVEKKERY